MSNTLLYYDPIFYAMEALIHLEKSLGLSTRVHRGYDASPQQKGSTINISKPGTFTAQSAPGSDANIVAEGVSMTLDKWYEVKFALSDKELTFTKEKIITDHIGPAAYALADQVDQDIAALYKDVYWWHGTAAATPDNVDDITGVKKVLRNANVPFDGRNYLMIDPAAEDKLSQLFYQASVVGDQGQALKTGNLGVKFGLDLFTNQNTPTHTAGTLAAAGGGVLAAKTETAAGATEITLDNGGTGTVTGTVVKGDVFSLAGNSQTYVVTADAAAAANEITIGFLPALEATVADGDELTPRADHTVNLAFHRNAFALATAPLSEMGNELGAKIATVNRDGISMRSRIWYEGNNSKVHVGLDILYGVKTLDARLAARLAG